MTITNVKHTSERFGIQVTQEEPIKALRFQLVWQEEKKETKVSEKTGKERTVLRRFKKLTDSKSVGLDGVMDLLDYCKAYNEKHKGTENSTRANVEVFMAKVKDE